jgi:hypothetical protein
LQGKQLRIYRNKNFRPALISYEHAAEQVAATEQAGFNPGRLHKNHQLFQ